MSNTPLPEHARKSLSAPLETRLRVRIDSLQERLDERDKVIARHPLRIDALRSKIAARDNLIAELQCALAYACQQIDQYERGIAEHLSAGCQYQPARSDTDAVSA